MSTSGFVRYSASRAFTRVALAAVTVGDLVGIDTSTGKLVPALSTSGSFVEAVGVAAASVDADEQVLVMPACIAVDSAVTKGTIYYLGTAGAYTTVKPNTTGDLLQAVGFGRADGLIQYDITPSPLTAP